MSKRKGAAGDLEGLHVEVKRCEWLRLYEAMKQAQRDAAVDQVAAVMHRANKQGWLIVVAVEDLIRLLDVVDTHRAQIGDGVGEPTVSELAAGEPAAGDAAGEGASGRG